MPPTFTKKMEVWKLNFKCVGMEYKTSSTLTVLEGVNDCICIVLINDKLKIVLINDK